MAVKTLRKDHNENGIFNGLGSWYNWTGEELMIADYVTCQESDLVNWKQFATEQEARAFWGLRNEEV